MNPNTLGIDVSKATLHLALIKGSGRPQKKQVMNDAVGFAGSVLDVGIRSFRLLDQTHSD